MDFWGQSLVNKKEAGTELASNREKGEIEHAQFHLSLFLLIIVGYS
jgi:hypothetical protein